MSVYCVKGVPPKTDRQIINKECSQDVHGNNRWQLINLKSKACNRQDTTSWDSFFWVEFIRVCSRFGFWDTQTRKLAVCLWAQSYVGPGWYHIAKWSRRTFPNPRRDPPLAVSVQKRHGRTSRDLLGGLWSYGASWTHTGFCPLCHIFQDTRQSMC